MKYVIILNQNTLKWTKTFSIPNKMIILFVSNILPQMKINSQSSSFLITTTMSKQPKHIQTLVLLVILIILLMYTHS